MALLQRFRDKGIPMSMHEYAQWVRLVCNGYVAHRKYASALRFLRKQRAFDSEEKAVHILDEQKQLRRAEDC